MNKVEDAIIYQIEQAMGIKLHQFQKDYILNKSDRLGFGRLSGRTMSYCIRLLLEPGPPLDLRRPEQFADMMSLSNHSSYARDFFRGYLMDIRNKLSAHGIPVRAIINHRGVVESDYLILDKSWAQIEHIGKVENISDDGMMALGSVYGELIAEIKRLKGEC